MERPAVPIQPVATQPVDGLKPPPTPPPPPPRGKMCAPPKRAPLPTPPKPTKRGPPKPKMSGNFAQELTGRVAQHLKAANNSAVQSQGGQQKSGGLQGATNHDRMVATHAGVINELHTYLGIAKKGSQQAKRRTVGRLNPRRLARVNGSNTENNNEPRIQIVIKVKNNCNEPTTSRNPGQKPPIPPQLSVLACKWELCKYFYPPRT